jgi:hypothetical protein
MTILEWLRREYMGKTVVYRDNGGWRTPGKVVDAGVEYGGCHECAWDIFLVLENGNRVSVSAEEEIEVVKMEAGR